MKEKGKPTLFVGKAKCTYKYIREKGKTKCRYN